MRMPNARQISEEQQDIFEDAPLDGCILVSGPPGTGKTVIAFLRASLLIKKSQDVTVLMYNRVLRRYTENVANEMEGKVQSKTMHSWFPGWWRRHEIKSPVAIENPVIEQGKAYLNCPFEEKDELKELGGMFDPNRINPYTGKPKVWFVPLKRYHANPDAYSRWLYSYEPIKLARWQYDWGAMRESYLELDSDRMKDWGHLIIDEAQDFEPGFYQFLRLVGRQLDSGALTILADENQRLEEDKHSSLQDLRNALKLNNKPEREFRLTKNFRNTLQIARVARHFYVGLETGKPELPNRSGVMPSLVSCGSTEQQINYICNYLRNRGALEVGVIVDSDADRELFARQIERLLNNYTVQTYSSKDSKNSDNLVFDKQGVVTILHRKSCKGLEFDAVFVPQLQSFSIADSAVTSFKMNLYVICSRARTELVFMCNGGLDSNPTLFQLFPSTVSGLIEYREHQ